MMSLNGLARRASVGCVVGLLAVASSSCSDPATTPAQGAFEATFSGSLCAATTSPGPNIGVGSANSQSWSPIPDGTNGVHVSCRVAGVDDKLAVSLRISNGSSTLEFSGNLPADKKPATTTSVSLFGPSTSGGVYVPNENTTCTATLIEGSGGTAKASFECDKTWNGVGSDKATCAFAGKFMVANCSQ